VRHFGNRQFRPVRAQCSDDEPPVIWLGMTPFLASSWCHWASSARCRLRPQPGEQVKRQHQERGNERHGFRVVRAEQLARSSSNVPTPRQSWRGDELRGLTHPDHDRVRDRGSGKKP
jgi:hypothetical protein